MCVDDRGQEFCRWKYIQVVVSLKLPMEPVGDVTADVHLVLEPCKARIITAGPAGQQYMGRYIQKTWSKSLNKHPAFVLTGRPCCNEDIEILSGKAEALYGLIAWSMLSGDYEASTDNIEIELTLAAADAATIACGFPLSWRPYVHSLLTKQVICYPKHILGLIKRFNNAGTSVNLVGLVSLAESVVQTDRKSVV